MRRLTFEAAFLETAAEQRNRRENFLFFLEDAIRMPDISKSVQRYQMAVDEAKVRLDLAVAPGTWLMPPAHGLEHGQAGPGMNLGVNDDVNQGTKKSALHLMAGGPSKINAPSSHPSNPIHKAAFAESKKPPPPTIGQTKPLAEKKPSEPTPIPPVGSGNEDHDVNKVIVALGAVALAGRFVLVHAQKLMSRQFFKRV